MLWRRYAARTLDLLLYGLVVDLVLFGWLRVFPPKYSLVQWALGAAALAVMVLVEPLLLMTLGTTPGKWLLGIRLVWRGGRKFFYSDGLVRTAQVAVQGLGLNIPVLKLFCLWRAWRNEKHGTCHPWEDPAEWYLVREKDRPALRLALCAAACAAAAFCSAVVQQQGYLPAAYTPGKGVTQEQCVQNFNAYANYYEASRGLNPDGSWVPPPYESYCTVELADGTEQTYKEQLPAPLVIETDTEGYVTRVSHVWQSSPYDQIITAPAQRMQLCLLSFAAAQPGVNGWRLTMQDALYNRQIGSGVHSAQFTVDGVQVRYTVTTQGFMVQELEDTGMIWRMDSVIDPDAFVRIEFVLEKLPG